ncbi:MAG: hypothetical protein P8X96_06315 [Desulfobacteraceae bacterium]
MKTPLFSYLIPILCLLLLFGCAGSESTNSVANDKALQAGETASFDHKLSSDTVDWASLSTRPFKPVVKETDREWPGERMGLIGPIVTSHGEGSRRFVLVYDSAGVLVGGLAYKEYKKEPRLFETLIKKAQARSEYQNYLALQFLNRKRLAAYKAALKSKSGGRHEN